MRSFTHTALLMAALIAFCDGQLSAQNPFDSRQPGYPDTSPFEDFEWTDSSNAKVKIGQESYQLKSINGVSIEQMLQKCADEGWNAQRRIAEDHMQILKLMGKESLDSVDLVVTDSNGKERTLNNTPVTRDNLESTKLAIIIRSNPFYSGAPGYPKWSPFASVQWQEDKPLVEFNGQKYFLVSIHGATFKEIAAKCEEEKWPLKMRFTEDLVQILRLMGKDIDRETFFELKDEKGVAHKFENVAMTSTSRRHLEEVTSLDRTQILADLTELQQQLEAQFSYLETNGFDHAKAIENIRADESIVTSSQLADAVQKKVANRFIDGHASVSDVSRTGSGYLPFLIEVSGDRYVALKPDRSSLVDADHHYISAIDGRAMAEWVESASAYRPRGSKQYHRRHALRQLRNIQQLRSDLGLPQNDTIRLTLVGEQSSDTKEVEMDLADKGPIYGLWPRTEESSILKEDIGYLRIVQMNEDAVEDIKNWMPKFKDTKGLIVDVRGNGGGIRTPILELAAHLMQPTDDPRIGNVCRYRLYEEFGKDHLSKARYVYRANSEKFNERERRAIEEFAATFKPEWEPQEDRFSQWHYLLLSKRVDDTRYFYDKPVIILCDEKCFSATDIFLSSFNGWPNVKLVGQPSGGGSARVQRFRLSNSKVSIRCASMASFQPNGQLYDTRGVQPDILVKRPPEYFLNSGKDVFVERAIEELLGARK